MSSTIEAKALVRGAPISSKDLDEWEARWAPVLRAVFQNGIDERCSHELAERLGEARRHASGVRRAAAARRRRQLAKDASVRGLGRKHHELQYSPDRVAKMSVKELRDFARRRGIGGVSQMGRDELILIIRKRL